MATEVVILKLGMTMTEGTVAEWLVPDGGEVKLGEPIYRLETEKIEMDVEAEAEGTVRHVVPEGSLLECGVVVAYILKAGEPMPGTAPAATAPTPGAPAVAPQVASAIASAPPASGDRVLASPSARRVAQERGIDISLVRGTGPEGRVTETDVQGYQPAAPVAASAPPPAKAAAPEPTGDILASPLARKLAEQLGVNLRSVKGTGPGGRITKEDVEAAATGGSTPAPAASAPTAPPAAPRPAPAAHGAGEIVPIRGVRKVIFQRMHQSLQSMAQLTLAMEVGMDEAVRLRTQLVEEWAPDGVKPSYTDLVIKAVAKALRKHPNANSQVVEAGIQLLNEIHVGMAVAIDDGLVVPVIRNADSLSLKDIAVESSRLANGARNAKLGPDDYAGGTFSVTALGMFGVDMFTPIINPPNAGILGVGRIHDTVGWEGDRPVKRQTMTLSLTWDHRVLDGAPAAEFVQTIKGLLEAPYRLLI